VDGRHRVYSPLLLPLFLSFEQLLVFPPLDPLLKLEPASGHRFLQADLLSDVSRYQLGLPFLDNSGGPTEHLGSLANPSFDHQLCDCRGPFRANYLSSLFTEPLDGFPHLRGPTL